MRQLFRTGLPLVLFKTILAAIKLCRQREVANKLVGQESPAVGVLRPLEGYDKLLLLPKPVQHACK